MLQKKEKDEDDRSVMNHHATYRLLSILRASVTDRTAMRTVPLQWLMLLVSDVNILGAPNNHTSILSGKFKASTASDTD
jgi:hypothetical protein